MPPDNTASGPNPAVILLLILVFAVAALLVVDHYATSAAHDPSHWLHTPGATRFIARYLRQRARCLPWIPLALALLGLVAALGFRGLKKMAAIGHAVRAKAAGMVYKKASYALPRVPFSLRQQILANPDPSRQIFAGVDQNGAPSYLTDRQRSMHLHVLGQTGSGKTKSVIEPMMLQDLQRQRGILLVDGKGSEDNEQRYIAMAAMTGRLHEALLFTLNPRRPTHTINPLHMLPDADPAAVGERVFSTFCDDMDNQYYQNEARELFISLVKAFASSGKPFSMLDIKAAIASQDLLEHGLSLGSDKAAAADIRSQFARLGRDVGKTFTGLSTAVGRYNHPAVNAYAPDIVLEHVLDNGQPCAFFLPVNFYKQLARYIGVAVFQHLQQVGALRQLDRSRPQTPVYVFADEFYSFAYEGFTDAVNKLRDANVSILLSHQAVSDLEKVSKEYADGIWANTRTKVMLYQNDEVAERLAKAIGTVKDVKETYQRSTDGFLNTFATLNASSREVDEFRLHPNRIKALQCGQGYITQDSEFVGLNFATVPDSLFDTLKDVALPARSKLRVDGLGLYDLFVSQSYNAPADAKPKRQRKGAAK